MIQEGIHFHPVKFCQMNELELLVDYFLLLLKEKVFIRQLFNL
jgi:hypothetical protein